MDFSRRLSLTTNAEEPEDGVQWGGGRSLSIITQAQHWKVSSLSVSSRAHWGWCYNLLDSEVVASPATWFLNSISIVAATVLSPKPVLSSPLGWHPLVKPKESRRQQHSAGLKVSLQTPSLYWLVFSKIFEWFYWLTMATIPGFWIHQIQLPHNAYWAKTSEISRLLWFWDKYLFPLFLLHSVS